MRATSSPSTLTAASLTRCTRARIASVLCPNGRRPTRSTPTSPASPSCGRAGSPTASGASQVPAETLGGYPLDVGLRIADGLLRAQALALPAAGELVDPWMLLWWNRQTRLVRFACTRGRDIWVHADLPVAALDERGVDRLLGLLVEAAVAVRDHAASAPREPA